MAPRSASIGPWLLVLGCSEPVDEPLVDDAWMLERTCVAPQGLGRPQHIAEVVTLIDALPHPVSLACVLEALDRPLEVAAVVSPFSAQPTEDPDSPRLFLFSGALVMTIVTAGDAIESLEFGEYVEPRRTLKADLEFPIDTPLDPGAPFAGALSGGSSRCATCHDNNQFAAMVGDAPSFISDALAPEPERIVPIGFVAQHARDCDDTTTPERCALLGAVFGHGPVNAGQFRADDQICITP